ncbi:MAG: hypothetical protein AAF360_02590 [Pseudomonadota bacterium]
MSAMTPTPSEIAMMAEKAGVKRLLLTHFRKSMDDEATHNAALSTMSPVFFQKSGYR